MPVVLLMVIGAAAGYLASRLMGYRTDVPTTMFLGVIGALVGAMGLRFLSTVSLWVIHLAAAVAGAMLVLWLWRVFYERR